MKAAIEARNLCVYFVNVYTLYRLVVTQEEKNLSVSRMQEHDCEEAFDLVNLLQVCALCDFEWPIRI